MATRAPAPNQKRNRRDREAPVIPDHEVLRQIGSGSFGEVWLAKAVTGVFRAVKMIHREDFENEKDFEREFEAIKRYEPISRQHPGLVQVLQVGRFDEEGFYYYIMEVADDLDRGPDIDPATYTPYTFRSQMLGSDEIDLDLCVKHGAMLAEALHFLHERDLIHRDVKLSNVIIVGGEAKLADIGLVAALGDRSFVGTEGYVPPEGAGTPSADIFSLGMVLYELSTGKDRLDFPDVPTKFREISDPELWRRINRVVCRACARRVVDRYETAEDMGKALRGEPLKERQRWPWIAGAAVALVALFAGITLFIANQPEPQHFDITSTPPGAKVFAGAESLGETPIRLPERPAEGVIYEIQKPGHNFVEIAWAGASDLRAAIHVDLEPSLFPQTGSPWKNSLGLKFKPVSGGHIMDFPVQAKTFNDFAISENRPDVQVAYEKHEHGGAGYALALASSRDSRAFADWMLAKDISEGYIGPDYSYRVATPEDTETEIWPKRRLPSARQNIPLAPFVVIVGKQRYGSIKITSTPPGADVFTKEGEWLGTTPHSIDRSRTGPVSYELRLPGHKPHYLDGVVLYDGVLELYAQLEPGQAVEFGKFWQNSIGMKFEPVGEQLLVSWYETRLMDYEQFCVATGHKMPENGLAKVPRHPIDAVSRDDAEAFCAWLTERERANNFITARHVYRLPTDVEWSQLANLPTEPGTTPETRNGSIEGHFPWGFDEWPPPPGAGNFSDQSRLEDYQARVGIITPNAPGPPVISDYNDGFAALAWADEFNPTRNNLYQVSGNVWEWVRDNFTGGAAPGRDGVIRGGAFDTSSRGELLSGYRRSLSATAREPGVGFRVVLTRDPGGS